MTPQKKEKQEQQEQRERETSQQVGQQSPRQPHQKSDHEKADLTHREDLSIAVMNLISIEEHLAFTAVKTNKSEYLDVLAAVRKLRVKLLKRLVVNTEGELWCISKHLLAATMRIMESSTKYSGHDNNAAFELEKISFDLYSLFWLLQKMGDEQKVTVAEQRAAGTSEA